MPFNTLVTQNADPEFKGFKEVLWAGTSFYCRGEQREDKSNQSFIGLKNFGLKNFGLKNFGLKNFGLKSFMTWVLELVPQRMPAVEMPQPTVVMTAGIRVRIKSPVQLT